MLVVPRPGAHASDYRAAPVPAGRAAGRCCLSMAKRPSSSPLPPQSWDIYLARHAPAKWIGTVEAADADAAIEEAVKQFAIQDTKRLIAVRRG
jgi:hypothetical protein